MLNISYITVSGYVRLLTIRIVDKDSIAVTAGRTRKKQN